MSTGTTLRDRACARVLRRKQKWRERFTAKARFFIAEYSCFTVDDIIESIGMPPGHPSAIGAAMLATARELDLWREGYTQSKRPSCHAAVIAIWRR